MPNCILHNVEDDQLKKLRNDLINKFPNHVDDMVIVQLPEDKKGETFCTVDSSPGIDEKELTRIRRVCAEHMEIRKRTLPEPNTVIFYDSRPKIAGKLETILESFVLWIRSIPQFLNGNPAPYVEIHGEISKKNLNQIRKLVDVEIWNGNKMTFYPKKS